MIADVALAAFGGEELRVFNCDAGLRGDGGREGHVIRLKGVGRPAADGHHPHGALAAQERRHDHRVRVERRTVERRNLTRRAVPTRVGGSVGDGPWWATWPPLAS